MLDTLFCRFLVVGCVNTLLGLGAIFTARQFVGEVSANLAGYLLVVPLSYYTHREFSFRDTGNRVSTFSRYVPTVCAGYAANVAVLRITLPMTNPYVAQSLAIGCHVVTTFLLSRIFVFLSPRQEENGR